MSVLRKGNNGLCLHSENGKPVVEVYSSVKGEVSEFVPLQTPYIFVNKGTLRLTLGTCKVFNISVFILYKLSSI